MIGALSTLACVNALEMGDNSTYEVDLPSNHDNITQTNSLNDIIVNAQDNDTIYLDNVTYDGENNTQITIDKSINFIGCDNTVIDGKNEKFLFVIEDNVKVSFKNIKFVNAYKLGTGDDVYGAALEIHNAEVIIDNCQFISNTINYGKSEDIYGAAISNMGNLTILNSYFLENSLNSDEKHMGFGGAIYNNGLLYVNNTSFIKSRGGQYSRGSVIYNDKIAFVNNSVIADTYSLEESMGSAIFNNGNFTLMNSIIENNTIERNNFNFIFGNIFNSGWLIAQGNIFKNNTGYYKQPNLGYEGSPTIYSIGNLNLSYNAFIDNVGGFKKIYRDIYINGGKSVSIDNNWWGDNANPFTAQAINVDIANAWLVLDAAPTYSTLNINESADIAVSWKLSSGLDSQFSLPLEVVLSDEFGHSQRFNLAKNCTFTFNNTQNKGLYTIILSLDSYNQTILVDVGKIKTSIVFESNNNIYPNENLAVNVSLYDENSNLVKGNVSVSIAGQNRIVNLANGSELIIFSNLIPDDYELKITYDGDDDYFKSFAKADITIKKYPVGLAVEEIEDKYVDENFTVNVNLATEEVEGAANLYLNGIFKKVVYLKKGKNTIGFSNFDEGSYNVTIEISGDEYYQTTNASAIFNVKKYDPQLNISSSDIFIKENETLIITALNDFKGEVILSINGANNTLFLNNSNVDITLSNLPADTYAVDLIFNGNAKYSPQKASTSFKVSKYSSSLVVTINDNAINVKAMPDICSGSVGVYVNRKYYQMNLTDGEANFNVEYDNGTNYIYVFYYGNEYYSQSSFNTTVGEGEAVAIIGENVTSYEYTDFTYTVSIFEQNGFAMPNKSLTIKIDSITYDVVTNSQGVAILPLNLKQGYYEVISTYKNLTATNYITVNPIEFNLTAGNVIYCEDVIIKAEFAKNITGKVNFTLSNGLTEIINITDGIASCTIENLTFGIWQVTAFYTNGLFNTTSKTASFEVERLESIIDLEIKEAFVGQDETIIAKANDLTGNLTFIIDSKEYDVPIENGEARLVISNLDGGSHILKVMYAGDASHKNATISKEFTIKTQKTSIVLSVNETPYGKEIKVIAKVDNAATGNITFSLNDINGSSQIKDGMASWSFSGLNVGNYNIKAQYYGDGQFMSTSASTKFSVVKARSAIEVYVNEAVLDENIRIYARVSPNATGKVSFSIEDYYSPRDKNVVNSTASWLIAPLKTGQYTVIATYRGDSNYYSSTTTYILNVSQTRSVLSVEVDDVSSNDRVIVKTTLISATGVNITGTVDVQVAGRGYTISVREGKGTLVLGKIKPGEYTLNAVYEGNENFSGSKASCEFAVSDSLLESVMTCENVTKYYNGDAKFVITLTNAKNKPIAHQTVYVIIKGVENSYETDDNGKVYLDIGNKVEKYDVRAEFRGSGSYHPSNATATVEVLSTIESEDIVKLYGTGVQYFAIFKDSNGKLMPNTKVMFKMLGKTYEYTTFPNGIIRLNIDLSPGKYSIVAINLVTGEMKTTTLFIYNKLMENKDVTNYFGAKSTYKVRAYGNNGKPVGAGVTVTFKVNGKTYNVKTDKKGYAKISIKLYPKQYVVTAQYNGLKVSNKITVKPVLTTKITPNKKTKKTKFTAKLINTKGKPLKGKKIIFKIKGKKYTAKTNKKGIASINIKLKLKKGTYKIYTIYGKSKVINKIKIK